MDPTLRAILHELFVVSQEVDRLRERVRELEAERAAAARPTDEVVGLVPAP